MTTIERILLDMSRIDDDGLIHEALLDDYAESLGVSLDEADSLLDDATESLVSKGVIRRVGVDIYLTSKIEEYEMSQAMAMQEARAAYEDMLQSYHQSIWG